MMRSMSPRQPAPGSRALVARAPFGPLTCMVAALALLASPAAAQQPATGTARADSAYRAPGATRGAGPNGATLRCGDGSYPAPLASDAACEGKGGVRVRFPLLRTPAPASTRVRPAPTAPPAVNAESETPKPTESRANVRIPAERPPADATLLCKDGTFIRADTSAARCGAHGGLQVRLRRPRG